MAMDSADSTTAKDWYSIGRRRGWQLAVASTPSSVAGCGPEKKTWLGPNKNQGAIVLYVQVFRHTSAAS